MPTSEPIVNVSESKAAGWTSRPRKVRYVMVPPHHLLEWIYDHVPTAPVPKDARFTGISLDAKENFITLDFESFLSPLAKSLLLPLPQFERILKDMLTSHLPTDAKITAIHLSAWWTLMMVEFASDRFPDAEEMPLIQLRYEFGELFISENSERERTTV